MVEHKKSVNLLEQMEGLEFRDSIDPATGIAIHQSASQWPLLKAIEKSNIAIYHFTGWFDAYADH